MSDGLPRPQYTIWQGVHAAVSLAMRALDEVRALAVVATPQDIGLDKLSIEYDGERTIHIRMTHGDRAKDCGSIVLPVAIYRGVFKEGSIYGRGDLTTWGGSVWHCNGETSEKPGDGSKDWTLAVKKGRDGRDGKDGEKGERGPEGKPGRDRY